jgi:hypothetical protein
MPRPKSGLIERVYSPIHHTIRAAKNIVNTGLVAVNNMGTSLTRHADMAVRNAIRGTRSGGRRMRARKATRKATRKSVRK